MKIHDKDDKKEKKKIITNLDEVAKMKEKLFSEAGLDSEGNLKEESEKLKPEELAQKLKKLRQAHQDEFEFDPNMFY